MAKKSPKDDPVFREAVSLKKELRDLHRELNTIDEAIAEIQVQRAECEAKDDVEASPLWRLWYKIWNRPKESTRDVVFGAMVSERTYDCISLSEPELVMLRGYKQGLIDDTNKRIQELSIMISED